MSSIENAQGNEISFKNGTTFAVGKRRVEAILSKLKQGKVDEQYGEGSSRDWISHTIVRRCEAGLPS